MNFGDKLTRLRKRNGLSQEELGNKLNVTRQTVSKWELGQSKPDTDKLMEISKLLNVDFNLLIDDSFSLDNNINNNSSSTSNVVIEDEVRPRKWLLIVLIVVAIIIVIFLLDGYVKNRKTEEEQMKDGMFSFFDIFTGFGESIMDSDFGASSFNSTFEMKTGTKSGFLVANLVDDIITNNKTNKENIITLVFDEFKSSDPTEIKNAKRKLENSTNYEISLDYDKKGFVNMVTIKTLVKEEEKETVINDFEIRTFNATYEMYTGTKNGISVSWLIDKIITNNKTNKERMIKVIYGSINTIDETEIRNLKKKLDDWTEYEVILDYDEVGFVNQITIEN